MPLNTAPSQLKIRQDSSRKLIINRAWVGILLTGLGCMGVLFLTYGYKNTYRAFGVPVTDAIFLDLSLITGSADSMKNGFDPAFNNPEDPDQRLFNYPRIWYLFFLLQIGKNSTILLGVCSLALFFVCLALFPAPGDWFTNLCLALVAFSSALMLAYERINVDILFLSAVMIALMLVERSALGSLGIMALSILFKVFPIMACGMYLDKNDKRSLWKVIFLAVFTLLYFMITWQDMLHILNVTQKGIDTSYGSQVAINFLQAKAGLTLPPYSGIISSGAALLLGGMAALAGFKTRGGLAEIDQYAQRAFLAGAGVFTGTFLLGNNWDYRLMFLLLTVPALSIFVRKNTGSALWAARLALVTLLLSCWYMLFRDWAGPAREARIIIVLFDETMNWLLYLSLAWMAAASLPKWFTRKAKPEQPDPIFSQMV